MVLPIIVPGGEFECEFGHSHQIAPPTRTSRRKLPKQAARHKQPQYIRVMWRDEDEQALEAIPASDAINFATTETVPSSAPISPDAARQLLVHHWRSLLGPPAPAICQSTNVASTLPTAIRASSVADESSANLSGDCEWLLRLRLRQRWDSLCYRERLQVNAVAEDFNWTNPVCEASALTSTAATWMLCAMYWCGVRHPASLHQKPLHPPTGLVRWISGFHTDQQATQAHEIQGQLDREMSAMSVRCEWLVRRMVETTNIIALLHELCEG